MWKGSELALVRYSLVICSEWRTRGFKDTVMERIAELCQDALYQHVWTPDKNGGDPWWLGHEGFHVSHQSNLIGKDPEHYQKYWPNVPPGLPYIWPPYRGE